jgi:hypothetical protein
MQFRTLPPAAWTINHFRTQAASTWECAHSPPLARAGRVPAATSSRTTTSRTLWAATGSAISCKAATTTQRKFCESSWAAWASPQAEKGDASGLHSAPPIAPRHAGTFTATCALGLATFSPTSRSSIHWLLPTFAPSPAPLAMPLLFGMLTSAGTTLPTTNARDMSSARSRLQPWDGSVPGPCNSSAKPPTPLFPNQGISVPSASPMCTASSLLCSAVTCLVCSPQQRVSTPHAQVPARSGAHRCPHQRFLTRRAGAAVGFVCVGRCLVSDCVLLIVVVFY